MNLNEDWLRWALALFIGIGTSAAVSLITTSNQLGWLAERMDLESAQIREILREREKVDRLTIDGIRNELEWIKSSLARLDRKADVGSLKPGLMLVQSGPAPEPVRILIFDGELKAMRVALDAYIAKLKEGKLSRFERDQMHSLEIDYEIKRGWQIWCETNLVRRLQCEKLYGD